MTEEIDRLLAEQIVYSDEPAMEFEDLWSRRSSRAVAVHGRGGSLRLGVRRAVRPR